MIKKVTDKESAKIKIRSHEATKDVVLAYSEMRYYYDLDGDKNIYGKTKIIDILSLKLHHNSPGGFDKYLSTFEELYDKLEACHQGLTDTHKRTIFLNGIKYEDFENVKDNCDNKAFKETVLEFKNKGIKLGKSGGTTKRYQQRNNNTTTKQGDHDEGNN